MIGQFSFAGQHSVTPRRPSPGGRVVLSRLPRGASTVWARSLSVKFVLDGEEQYQVGTTTHVVRPGSFLVIDTLVPVHAVLRRSADGLCLAWPSRAGVLPELTASGIVLQAANSEFGRRIHAAAEELLEAELPSWTLAEDLLQRAEGPLRAILAEVGEQAGRLSAIKARTRHDMLQRLDMARAFIAQHDDKRIGLANMAEAAGMSAYHFARHFNEAYGETPAAYHQRLRLARAWSALRSGQTVSEAAARSGFDHPGSFGRAFKARYGVPPSQVPATG